MLYSLIIGKYIMQTREKSIVVLQQRDKFQILSGGIRYKNQYNSKLVDLPISLFIEQQIPCRQNRE